MHIGFFDGSASPNPGNVGLGACICFQQNVICKSAKYGGTGTNNVAEYKALIHLLELAIAMNVKVFTVYGDSQLVINQVNGVWGVTNERLKNLYDRVQSLRSQIEECVFKWISRHNNKIADSLSREGLKLSKPKTVYSKSENIGALPSVDKADQPIDLLIQRFSVRPLGNYHFRIDQIGYPAIVVNLRNLHCSCDSFRGGSACLHVMSISRLMKKGVA